MFTYLIMIGGIYGATYLPPIIGFPLIFILLLILLDMIDDDDRQRKTKIEELESRISDIENGL